MRQALYVPGGLVEVVEAPAPMCPPGGLLVRTEACGLCSGELMAWYQDRKGPHVLGHEVAGTVVESEDARFPVGCRVAPHHHAPCLACPECDRGAHVHCATWKRTSLEPGGMAEMFAVPSANLADTHRVDDLRPRDAALMEPLACVAKSLRRLGYKDGEPAAVVGLGVMGLMHLTLMPGAVGTDVNPARVKWAQGLGLDARLTGGGPEARCVVVCPGSQAALDAGLACCAPDARLCLFAPFPHGSRAELDLEKHYMRDLSLTTSYSCGPQDTDVALRWLREGRVSAEQVVSDFVSWDALPSAYAQMRGHEILKAMVEV